MTRLPARFLEDKAIRDSARDVLRADIAHAKATLSGKGIANRVGSRIGDGAKDVAEIAKVQAEDHRGFLAVLIGALVLWFARNPIMEVLGLGTTEEEGDAPEEDSQPAAEEAEQQAEPIDHDEARSGEENE